MLMANYLRKVMFLKCGIAPLRVFWMLCSSSFRYSSSARSFLASSPSWLDMYESTFALSSSNWPTSASFSSQPYDYSYSWRDSPSRLQQPATTPSNSSWVSSLLTILVRILVMVTFFTAASWQPYPLSLPLSPLPFSSSPFSLALSSTFSLTLSVYGLSTGEGLLGSTGALLTLETKSESLFQLAELGLGISLTRSFDITSLWCFQLCLDYISLSFFILPILIYSFWLLFLASTSSSTLPSSSLWSLWFYLRSDQSSFQTWFIFELKFPRRLALIIFLEDQSLGLPSFWLLSLLFLRQRLLLYYWPPDSSPEDSPLVAGFIFLCFERASFFFTGSFMGLLPRRCYCQQSSTNFNPGGLRLFSFLSYLIVCQSCTFLSSRFPKFTSTSLSCLQSELICTLSSTFCLRSCSRSWLTLALRSPLESGQSNCCSYWRQVFSSSLTFESQKEMTRQVSANSCCLNRPLPQVSDCWPVCPSAEGSSSPTFPPPFSVSLPPC